VIHPSKEGVQEDFNRLYGIDVNYIAFYSPTQNIVFYSADNAELRVVAHEIGHVIAEHYFQVSPPSKIHEVLAQYAEKHVTE
jgi:predicted Zn-dependent protease